MKHTILFLKDFTQVHPATELRTFNASTGEPLQVIDIPEMSTTTKAGYETTFRSLKNAKAFLAGLPVGTAVFK